jgi:hypothetical protein
MSESRREIMMVKPLVVSVLALMTCGVQAAGLDRSGQSILPFLQSGNYLEVGASYLSPQVGGKDTSGNTVPEMTSRMVQRPNTKEKTTLMLMVSPIP